MHRRAREILSSTAFLASLAVGGLFLLSWPLVTVLASVGSLGQLLSLFVVWLALVLGGLVWACAQENSRDCPGEGSENPACIWPSRKREDR